MHAGAVKKLHPIVHDHSFGGIGIRAIKGSEFSFKSSRNRVWIRLNERIQMSERTIAVESVVCEACAVYLKTLKATVAGGFLVQLNSLRLLDSYIPHIKL